jgi:hypothetical protein
MEEAACKKHFEFETDEHDKRERELTKCEEAHKTAKVRLYIDCQGGTICRLQ